MNKHDTIRLVGMVQAANANLDFLAAKIAAVADGEDARRLKRIVGAAMYCLAELSAELYCIDIASIPAEMRPPNLQTDDQLKAWAERMRDVFRRQSQ
jgi:hypothetical protein